eukprot:5141138-Pyramimonas_sp.AAC.1
MWRFSFCESRPCPIQRASQACKLAAGALEHRLTDPYPHSRGLGPTGRFAPPGGDFGSFCPISKGISPTGGMRWWGSGWG